MPESFMAGWLRKIGIKDERHLRDKEIVALGNWDSQIQSAIDRGTIDPAFGAAAQRSLARMFQHQIAESPELYARYRETDKHGRSEWDNLSERAQGYSDDDNESGEAAAQREDDALRVVMTHDLAQRFYDGRIDGQGAYVALENLDPRAISEGRRRAGYNQVKEGSLDNELRDLTPDEQGVVAAVGWYDSQGMTSELPQERSDAPAPAEHAGDYSPSEMEAFVQRRNRETSTKED